jgi:y4mF family transcriptional regulator
MKKNKSDISKFVQTRRKQIKLTQQEMAIKAGVGLRFVRDLEQGKTTMRMDKVNDVLILFGATLGIVPIDREKLLINQLTKNNEKNRQRLYERPILW